MSLVLTTINYKEAIKGFPPSYFLSCSCFALVLWFTKIGFLYLIQLKSDFNFVTGIFKCNTEKKTQEKKNSCRPRSRGRSKMDLASVFL